MPTIAEITNTLFKTVLPILSLVACQSTIAATATIASASNFKSTLEELLVTFHQQQPHKLKIVTAATGVLFNQIKHGAPFDIFLAADVTRPAQLEKQGKALANTRFTYAEGRLALAFNPKQQIITGPLPKDKNAVIDILERNLGKIAIANPDIAPYGIAAKQSLYYLYQGKHKRLKHIQQRLVRGANINQSLHYVTTGNVEAGYVALAQVLATSRKFHYWVIPKHWHKPIRQQAVLLQAGKHNQAAIIFMHFLKTSTAKTIIQRYGYNTNSQ